MPYSILDSIGNTPLVEIEGIYTKFEGANPSGSTKDRIALEMVLAAERSGELHPGGHIIEPTSGNAGIALAMVARVRGYTFTAVMPSHFSEERKNMLRAFGAELFETSPEKGFMFAIEEARRLAQERSAFMPDQFNNPSNVTAQEKQAREVLDAVGAPEAAIIGIGTGGTLMGYANTMIPANPKIKIFSVEPAESMLLFNPGAQPKPHKIQGIGASSVTDLLDKTKITEPLGVSSDDALLEAKRLMREHGLFVGISSGANMLAARRTKEKYGFSKVVTVLPDRADRYYSMGILER